MLEQFYKDCRNELVGWSTALTHDPQLSSARKHLKAALKGDKVCLRKKI